jgi:carboxymethylenebutenolidase
VAFTDRVASRGVPAQLHVYQDAPHSFFDKAFAEYAADCADAWHRMLAFVDRYSV